MHTKRQYQKNKISVILTVLLCMLACLILVFLGYLLYVILDYHRIGDQVSVTVQGNATESASVGDTYQITSWNIGFGAYEDDFDFFMDGGTHSWAFSKERLTTNMEKISSYLESQNSDFYLIQEVDSDATRTYHVDERDYFYEVFPEYSSTFAQNYDSPFLFYPITQPHGASQSGLVTLSKYKISKAVRRELEVENSVYKILDLDRCFSVNRIPLESGNELVLINLHLSAYTSTGTVAQNQFEFVLQEMQKEYEKGNYCIAGGDFNMDLLTNSSEYFGEPDKDYSWAKPVNRDLLSVYNMELIVPFDEDNPVPSSRNADAPYHDGQFVVTLDGFLVSPNVTVMESDVLDTGFAYSDHNPVYMTFRLN